MVIYPPQPLIWSGKSIFLAGSIDMGLAPDWQQMVIDQLDSPNLTILNPRRKDWDSSWEQRIENQQFNEQVTWELEGLERADLILMYLDPATQAPISLMELGLSAAKGTMIVCCPEGYWRKGNVDIVCKKYEIPQSNTLIELIEETRLRLGGI